VGAILVVDSYRARKMRAKTHNRQLARRDHQGIFTSRAHGSEPVAAPDRLSRASSPEEHLPTFAGSAPSPRSQIVLHPAYMRYQLDVSTAGDEYIVGELHGEGTVSLHVEQLDLGSGSCWLDVGVHEADRSRPYDYLREVLPFQVGSSRREPPNPSRWWSIR
jgi:hypothetical protein